MEKVLVFRDDDAAFLNRLLPDVAIGYGIHAAVEHMKGIRSRVEPAGEGRRELMIHEELHAAASTAWSACRAA